jgi:hypothetical protein
MLRANRSLPLPVPAAQLVVEGQPVGLLDLELGAGREKPPVEVERREWGRMVSLAKHPGQARSQGMLSEFAGPFDEGPDWLIQRPSTTAAAEFRFPVWPRT